MNLSYRELIVWQKSMDLVTEIYKIVGTLPKDEKYCLSDQMRRAAVSIPSNIAEGQSRASKKDFINFLSIARGSDAELETQLLICVRIHYLTEPQIETAISLCNEIKKMISAMIAKFSPDT